MVSRRLAILGASGFVGRALTKLATQGGHEVVCLGRNPLMEAQAGQWIACDLAAPTGTIPIPQGTEAVFYLAQSAHYREFPRYADDLFAINTQGVARAAQAALAAGCRFFCYASSGNVYAPSFQALTEDSPTARHSPYAVSKLMGEDVTACFKELMHAVSARIFGAYGPGQRAMLPWILAQRIRQGQPVELAPGPQGQDGGLHVSFIYVDDLALRLLWLAEAALEGLSLPSVLNLAGPEEVSLKKFSEVLGSYLGNPPVFSYLSTPRCGDLKADIRLLDSLCPLTYTKLNDGLRALCAHMEDPSRTGSQ